MLLTYARDTRRRPVAQHPVVQAYFEPRVRQTYGRISQLIDEQGGRAGDFAMRGVERKVLSTETTELPADDNVTVDVYMITASRERYSMPSNESMDDSAGVAGRPYAVRVAQAMNKSLGTWGPASEEDLGVEEFE